MTEAQLAPCVSEAANRLLLDAGSVNVALCFPQPGHYMCRWAYLVALSA